MNSSRVALIVSMVLTMWMNISQSRGMENLKRPLEKVNDVISLAYEARTLMVEADESRTAQVPVTIATFSSNVNSVSFGALKLGQWKDTVVTIINTGTDTLKVSSIISTRSSFAARPSSIAVPPGQSKSDTIRFIADSVGTRNGRIIYVSNDPQGPDTIAVNGYALGIPQLVTPTNNATNQLTTLTFKWNKLDTIATYAIDLGFDSTFASGLVVTNNFTSDTFYNATNLQVDTAYYWRVISKKDNAKLNSSIRVLRTGGPKAFILIKPSNSYASVNVWDEFSWNKSVNAKKYYLEVSTTPTFVAGTFDVFDCDTSTTIRPPVDLVMGTPYFWRVRAVDTLGRERLGIPDTTRILAYRYLVTQDSTFERTVAGEIVLPYSRTLRKENTPYVLRNGNLQVPTGKTFTIRNGTTFRIESARYLQIDGTLKVLGLAGDSVRIVSNNALPARGDWQYIRITANAVKTRYDVGQQYSGGSVIRYAEIAHTSDYAVRIETDSILVERSRIHDVTGAIYNSRNCGVLRSLNMSNSTRASSGGSIYSTGKGCILDSLIVKNSSSYTGSTSVSYYGGAIFISGSNNVVSNSSVSGYVSASSASNCYGGAIYVSGNSNVVSNSAINGYASSNNASYCYGGAIYVAGDSNRVKNITVLGSYTYVPSYYGSYGGGCLITGNYNTISYSLLSGNNANGGNARSGGGLYLSGNGNLVLNSTIINNSAQGSNGGGLTIEGSANNVVGTTVSNNTAGYGGGIYATDPNLRITGCTITNNVASVEGGGVYSARGIYNSIISYNRVTSSSNGGGVFGDPDTIVYCNISGNSGYQLKKNSSSDTQAKNNWWLTRSDVGGIASKIWDKADNSALGYAYYSPILTDESPNTPGKFSSVSQIKLYEDSLYSIPLQRSLGLGDNLYVEVVGADSNKFAKNVTVLFVQDQTNVYSVRPFAEETNDSSATFHFRVSLRPTYKPEDSLRVATGDSLVLYSEDDYSKRMIITIAPIVRGTCQRMLRSNWNLVSWNIDTPNDSAQVIFQGISSNTTVVLGFDSVGRTYSPTLPPGISSLRFVDHLHGYWIKSSKDSVNFVLNGILADPQSAIRLRRGNNLVSYLASQQDSTRNVISPIISKCVRVLGFDGGGLTYDPTLPAGLNTLTLMKPGFGYWIIMADSATLHFPTRPVAAPGVIAGLPGSSNKSVHQVASQLSSKTNEWISVWAMGYKVNGALIPVGTVINFQNIRGVVCGTCTISEKGIIPLTPIYHDDPTTLEDEGCRDDEDVAVVIEGNVVASEVHWTSFGDVIDLNALVTSSDRLSSPVPNKFFVKQNYPNPFNPSTTIEYGLPKLSYVSIKIFNVLGQQVAVLVNSQLARGYHRVVWNTAVGGGVNLTSGIYLVRIEAGEFVETRKMLLLK